MKIIVLDNLNLNAFKKFCHRTEQDADYQIKSENAYRVVIWTSGYLIT